MSYPGTCQMSMSNRSTISLQRRLTILRTTGCFDSRRDSGSSECCQRYAYMNHARESWEGFGTKRRRAEAAHANAKLNGCAVPSASADRHVP